MSHESLLKGLIAFFTIIFIVLATFVYGNIERSKQKTASSTNQATVLPPAETTKTNPTPTTTAVAPSVTTPKTTPTTGAGDNVLPMTILSVLGYMLFRYRKKLTTQKS